MNLVQIAVATASDMAPALMDTLMPGTMLDRSLVLPNLRKFVSGTVPSYDRDHPLFCGRIPRRVAMSHALFGIKNVCPIKVSNQLHAHIDK